MQVKMKAVLGMVLQQALDGAGKRVKVMSPEPVSDRLWAQIEAEVSEQFEDIMDDFLVEPTINHKYQE